MPSLRKRPPRDPPCNAEEIRRELQAVLESDEFVGSPRDRDFLRYVVEEALAGRGERLKAYSIATEVFGRDATFDPEHDPVVRTTAARVRRALERYYLLAQRDTGTIIEVPKGGYEPLFRCLAAEMPEDPLAALPPERHRVGLGLLVILSSLALATLGFMFYAVSRTKPAEPARPVAQMSPPRVIVTLSPLGGSPDRDSPAQATAADLTDQIVGQFAKFREYQVIGPGAITNARTPGEARSLEQKLGVAYVLEGSVLANDTRVRVTARLVETLNGGVVWAHTYDKTLGENDPVTIRNGIAREVVIALAQPYGAIFRAEQMKVGGVNDPASYGCTSQYWPYRAARTPAWHGFLRECLERAVSRLSSNPVAWGTLALLYVDEERFAYNRKLGGPAALQRAKEAAQNALRLDPDEPRALQALMIALGVAGDHEGAVRMGERAVALNQNDTELSGELGLRLCMAGEPERGSALVRQALTLNPAHAGFYNGNLAFCAYVNREYDVAVDYVGNTSRELHHFYDLIAAISLAQVGRLDEAREHAARFRRQRPDFVRNWETEWTGRLRRAGDRSTVREGAEKAGLIEPKPATSAPELPREPIWRRG